MFYSSRLRENAIRRQKSETSSWFNYGILQQNNEFLLPGPTCRVFSNELAKLLIGKSRRNIREDVALFTMEEEYVGTSSTQVQITRLSLTSSPVLQRA